MKKTKNTKQTNKSKQSKQTRPSDKSKPSRPQRQSDKTRSPRQSDKTRSPRQSDKTRSPRQSDKTRSPRQSDKTRQPRQSREASLSKPTRPVRRAKPEITNKRQDRPSRHVDIEAKMDVMPEAYLYSLLDNLKNPPFLLILDGLQDPHNLGACLRSADGAGVQAVIIPKDRSVSLTDTVRNVASGAAENIPLVQVTNLARTLRQLKDRNIWLVGTTEQAKKSIYEIDLKGPIAIVLGSEGKGLRRLTTDLCDFKAHIPMAGKVESLNVSVATGVCLFEAVRQRSKK